MANVNFAVAFDIDHSPEVLLAEEHGDFYSAAGVGSAAAALSDQGVYALWSDDPPEDRLLDHLRTAFTHARAEVVSFDNPITGGSSSCTVYVANRPASRPGRPGLARAGRPRRARSAS